MERSVDVKDSVTVALYPTPMEPIRPHGFLIGLYTFGPPVSQHFCTTLTKAVRPPCIYATLLRLIHSHMSKSAKRRHAPRQEKRGGENKVALSCISRKLRDDTVLAICGCVTAHAISADISSSLAAQYGNLGRRGCPNVRCP